MNGGSWLVQNRLESECSAFEHIDFPSGGLHLYVADCVSRSAPPYIWLKTDIDYGVYFLDADSSVAVATGSV